MNCFFGGQRKWIRNSIRFSTLISYSLSLGQKRFVEMRGLWKSKENERRDDGFCLWWTDCVNNSGYATDIEKTSRQQKVHSCDNCICFERLPFYVNWKGGDGTCQPEIAYQKLALYKIDLDNFGWLVSYRCQFAMKEDCSSGLAKIDGRFRGLWLSIACGRGMGVLNQRNHQTVTYNWQTNPNWMKIKIKNFINNKMTSNSHHPSAHNSAQAPAATSNKNVWIVFSFFCFVLFSMNFRVNFSNAIQPEFRCRQH